MKITLVSSARTFSRRIRAPKMQTCVHCCAYIMVVLKKGVSLSFTEFTRGVRWAARRRRTNISHIYIKCVRIFFFFFAFICSHINQPLVVVVVVGCYIPLHSMHIILCIVWLNYKMVFTNVGHTQNTHFIVCDLFNELNSNENYIIENEITRNI